MVGKVLVSITKYEVFSLKETIRKAVQAIGGFKKFVKKGDTILLKPNFNSDDPFPASSDPEFVKSVIELLYEYGAKKVILGECSGIYWFPTKKIMKNMGMLKAAKETKAEVVFFEDEPWIEVDVKGRYLKKVKIAERALQGWKMVWLPCLKTHHSSRFTMSLKLAMGFTKRIERPLKFHVGHIEERIAELNTILKPHLIIMDGRKCFVTGGPDKGDVESPNLILASTDRIAIDVEGIKILKNYKAENINMPTWQLPQIKRAVELGIGVKNEKEYLVKKV